MSISRKIPLYVLLVLVGVVSLLPFYVLLFLALSPSDVSFADTHFIIRYFEFDNFIKAWEKSNLGGALTNSLIITGGTVLLTVLTAAGSGYVFARSKHWFNKSAYGALLFSMMIPGIINTVPLYILMRKINGINTHWAMILLLTTMSIPFSAFLYTNFIKTLSKEIEESAVIDGCTKFTAFWRISFPLLKPITSTVVIINSVNTWNNYSQSVFFLQDQGMQTVPLSISRFVQSFGADYTMMAAGSTIGMLPAVLVFLVLQRYFIKGMSAGAVKG